MTGEDALLTTAEIAVAFAGFASVVTVFRRGDDDRWQPGDAVRFQLMITTSLSVVFFALLPFALLFFGLSERGVWGASSAALALYVAVVAVRLAPRVPALTRSRSLNPLIAWSSIGAAIAVVGLETMNAAGVVFERELGPYFVGLLHLLLIAGLSFARLLPLGRSSAPE